jgi:cephalosporin-C deacetylase-like acetyl esterase
MVPVLMGLGFNDLTCPPTSMLAAYNAIPSAKEMKIHPAMGHQYIQDFEEFSNQWLLARLKTK